MWYERLIIWLIPALLFAGLVWWKGIKVALITYGLVIVVGFVLVIFALRNFRG
jgi:hypothetical protein